MAVKAKVILKPGKEKPVLAGHPWVYSGAISSAAQTEPGEIVEFYDHEGEFLAQGFFNQLSQISGRLLTRDPHVQIDHLFFKNRILESIERRRGLIGDDRTNCYRLVHYEADKLPGLVIDQYGDWVVVQSQCAGIDRWRDVIHDTIAECLDPAGIYERNDDPVREKEGLVRTNECPRGGHPPPNGVTVLENGRHFLVDIEKGHKTGFYLDQRENRRFIGSLAEGKKVLNLFSYTGGFSVYCASAGARQVISVDSSKRALSLARRNMEANGLFLEDDAFIEADVANYLRATPDETFDMIILDPPKFAHNRHQINKASRAYKDIARLAFSKLEPGGMLASFSCSGAISPELFQKIQFAAEQEAQVSAQILRQLSQAADHPVLLEFPESHYLKGMLLRVI